MEKSIRKETKKKKLQKNSLGRRDFAQRGIACNRVENDCTPSGGTPLRIFTLWRLSQLNSLACPSASNSKGSSFFSLWKVPGFPLFPGVVAVRNPTLRRSLYIFFLIGSSFKTWEDRLLRASNRLGSKRKEKDKRDFR